MSHEAPPSSLTAADVEVGDELPGLEIDLTATFVVSTALASRDFEPVHHDRSRAEEQGLDDVFLNILTSNGLAVRLVTDWAGPDAIVKNTSIRLGVPSYAGDTLTLAGTVKEVEQRDDDALVRVAVRGVNSIGDHVTGTVTVSLAKGAA